MILACVTALLLQTPTREARVLELLSRVELGWHYSRSRFRWTAAPFGTGRVVQPLVDVFCGNSDQGCFDDDRARVFGRELLRVYGLYSVRNEQLGDGGRVSVLLDGLDPVRKIGFKLRGRGTSGMDSEGMPEIEEAALDEREFAWLVATGYRVHVADVAPLRDYDGDGFTPTLAFLAGLVEFLNGVTEGEDVDLGGLLFEREATWAWPEASALSTPDGMRASEGGHSLELVVERAGTLEFPCKGLADFATSEVVTIFGSGDNSEEEQELRRLKGSTRGAPTVLVVRGGEQPLESAPKGPDPQFRMRVRQKELVRESASFLLLLPSEFDLAQPFVLEFELSRGRYSFYNRPRIGAAAR